MEFKQLAQQAAEMERNGDTKEAAVAWRKSGEHSNSELNRDWCAARAAFCESRLWRGNQA